MGRGRPAQAAWSISDQYIRDPGPFHELVVYNPRTPASRDNASEEGKRCSCDGWVSSLGKSRLADFSEGIGPILRSVADRNVSTDSRSRNERIC